MGREERKIRKCLEDVARRFFSTWATTAAS
jgi:hypothetical protein